jgi:acyl-coenzyme A synthetase/AMP-(fatty) acid ligase
MLPAMDGAVGYVVPGVSVDVVSPSGTPLPPGREGLVRIRSAGLAAGYIGDPETTRLRFRDGGFYPGDIGMMTADGVLVIRGREQAVINLGGDKISPERVEAALASFPAVKEGAALAAWANSEVQILVAAVVWQNKADKDGLLDHLRRQLPAVFIPKLVVTVDSIPRNAAGKIDRQRLKELIAQRTAETSSN